VKKREYLGQATGGKRTPTYRSWQSMKLRCLKKTHNRYNYYGGRGIKLCERWLSFGNFLADMGERPAGTSLDRINNDGDYEPGNCRWATQTQQVRNSSNAKPITIDGETLCISEWAERAGISPMALIARVRQATEAVIRNAISPPDVSFPNNVNDLVGRKFGKLTVIGFSHAGPHGAHGRIRYFWHCQCECGGKKTVYSSLLTGKLTGSCGCMADAGHKNLVHNRNSMGAQ
jgi:hypothetical protein